MTDALNGLDICLWTVALLVANYLLRLDRDVEDTRHEPPDDPVELEEQEVTEEDLEGDDGLGDYDPWEVSDADETDTTE